ncbi:MAG: type III polyketide synthase [Candidatus Obscuribacterales bacterium]
MKPIKAELLSRILAIGTATPSRSISQSNSCQQAQQFFQCDDKGGRTLRVLYKRTEIERRALVVLDKKDCSIDRTFFSPPQSKRDRGPSTAARMARYSSEVAPLALAACRSAIELAQIGHGEITHLVTASCTGFAAPGFDLALIKGLPLRPTTERTHIGFMGCHGALNALRVADAYCRADAKATVLVCAAELCSVHMQYEWSAQRLVANALFADGAAAVVVRASGVGGLLPVDQPVASPIGWPQYLSSQSVVIDSSSEAMSWEIGDNGFVMTLAAEVPALIEKYLPAFIEKWLAQSNLRVSDIKSWAVHPGGPRILQAVQDSLQLDAEMLSASRAILAEQGNMSSPTVLFILQRLLQQNDKFPCVMLGFGPGLTVEAALIG